MRTPLIMVVAFHKPYGVLSQFRDDGSKWLTLSGFGFPERIYPVGRLDADSEGLLILTDEAPLNARLIHPESSHPREYWVQVERIPEQEKLRALAQGVRVLKKMTSPCKVRRLENKPDVPERIPPIRYRKSVPTCWLSLELVEGRNRQVRRMTAAIGHPTLRLIRVRMGALNLKILGINPGEWKQLKSDQLRLLFSKKSADPSPKSQARGESLA